ncbi:Enoyl-CoA delta isomerase 2, peroxisomal [Capsicum baccatum]|uniref:Delta(3)-Delta(2)-enoyl-CoA isomerase n=1 Tax=Capsicum baccatum TaxID=33114 RepID=A0A2G2WJA1_CAPBA|nr:Enoyl-CoA delta isomerase 2, peroxisomal [Capsicum baccatum]
MRLLGCCWLATHNHSLRFHTMPLLRRPKARSPIWSHYEILEEDDDGRCKAVNGQYLFNYQITVSYAYNKDTKGGRHGTNAGGWSGREAGFSGHLEEGEFQVSGVYDSGQWWGRDRPKKYWREVIRHGMEQLQLTEDMTLDRKAVANSTSTTFLYVIGSELIHKYLGDEPKFVRELFGVADDLSPSLFFIGEIDAVGTKRCNAYFGGEREIPRTMLKLLKHQSAYNEKVIYTYDGLVFRDVELKDRSLLFDSLSHLDKKNIIHLQNLSKRFDKVEVIGTRQKKGDVSISERLVGGREYTIYRIRVWSGKDNSEVEKWYREFYALYWRLKLFIDQGRILPPVGPALSKNHERTSYQYLTTCGSTFFRDQVLDIEAWFIRGDGEHRLNPTLIANLRSSLSQVKSQAVKGSVLITKAEGRFFSNGFDLKYAQAGGSPQAARDRLLNMVDLFKPLVADFMCLPIPTIAAVTGHAAAAGLLLAMSHDYVTMRSDKSVMYMSELDIGMTLPDYFTAMIRSKVGSGGGRRNLVLKAAKIRAEEAVMMGLVDSAHPTTEETVDAALTIAEALGKKRWDGKAYAEIRKSLVPELCALLGLKDVAVMPSRL